MPPPPATETCTCGVNLPVITGPIHRYMLSTPSCWEAYGRLLAREYEDPSRWRTHRITVDAYAVQHPGVDTPQARNSVGIHLSRLCLLFDRGWPLQRANAAMLAITAKKFDYPWLSPPVNISGVNVLDILAVTNAGEHMAAVERWGRAVWLDWQEHHPTVHQWLLRID